jgi:hypothetical protein
VVRLSINGTESWQNGDHHEQRYAVVLLQQNRQHTKELSQAYPQALQALFYPLRLRDGLVFERYRAKQVLMACVFSWVKDSKTGNATVLSVE